MFILLNYPPLCMLTLFLYEQSACDALLVFSCKQGASDALLVLYYFRLDFQSFELLKKWKADRKTFKFSGNNPKKFDCYDEYSKYKI